MRGVRETERDFNSLDQYCILHHHSFIHKHTHTHTHTHTITSASLNVALTRNCMAESIPKAVRAL